MQTPDTSSGISFTAMAPRFRNGRHKFWFLVKTTFSRFNDENPFTMSAALSYYTIFSLPALLISIIGISGYFFGHEAVQGKIYNQFKDLIGPEGAVQIQEMVQKAGMNKNTKLATIVSLVTIFLSATAVFGQLQLSLNQIWGVAVKPGRAIRAYIRDRVFSFGMIAVFAFLLLISLIISSVLAVLGDYISAHFSFLGVVMAHAMDLGISLGIYIVLFALIFKILPDVKIRWKEVWVGSTVTALLFAIGKFLIGFYLGKGNPGSAYGAAGSVILVLLWVSYSSLIMFLGAVFTNVYAETYGHKLEPADYAYRVKWHDIPQVPGPEGK